MGQDLTGKPPKATYRWLLQIGTHLLGALRRVSLGNGTDSALSLSENKAKIHGDLDVTGSIINADLVKISALTNDLITGGTTTAPTAEQVKILKGLIDQINTVLTSDDVNLDELQELVTYIKANRGDIDSLGIAGINGLQDVLDALIAKSWDAPTTTPTALSPPSFYPDGKVTIWQADPAHWPQLVSSATLKVDRRGIGTRMELTCHNPLLYQLRYGTGNSNWQAWNDDESPAQSEGNQGITSAMTPQQLTSGKLSYARVYGSNFPINGINKAGLVENKDLYWKGNSRMSQHFYGGTEAFMRTAFNASWTGWNQYVFQGDSFYSSGTVTHIDQLTSNLQSSVNMAMLKAHLATQLPTYTDDAAADADAALPSGSRYKLNGSRAIYQKP